MSLKSWLLRKKAAPALDYKALARPTPVMRISENILASVKAKPRKKIRFQPPILPPGVIPPDVVKNPNAMVMDSTDVPYIAFDSAQILPFYQYANQFQSGLGFPGYPYLAEKQRISEYRAPSETTANEMTRKWIKFKSNGTEDRSEQIAELEKAFKDFKVRRAFKRAQLQDGFFGRSQIYIRIQNQLDDDTRKKPLMIDPTGIPKGSLLGFQVIEPYWTTPYWYETNDPTSPDFYKPVWWFILGKQTHASRLMIFVSRELPDLYKPAFNFSGMSLTQLCEPDIEQWLGTRNAVARIIRNFRTSVLKTNMAATLSGEDTSGEYGNRAKLFTETADNEGLMMLDKDTEEFLQVNTPLSGLAELQAQSQEHMCPPSHIPLVKLTGITPSGLNASGEEEMQVWYDYVKTQQVNDFDDHIVMTSHTIQCHLWGKIYDDIVHEFVELTELDGEGLARVRKSDAEAGSAYIQTGVVSPEEERERIARDPNSGYDGLSGAPPDPPPQMQSPSGFEDDGDDDEN
jgi:phage-related protein (TIGR01555 family)